MKKKWKKKKEKKENFQILWYDITKANGIYSDKKKKKKYLQIYNQTHNIIVYCEQTEIEVGAVLVVSKCGSVPCSVTPLGQHSTPTTTWTSGPTKSLKN